MTMFSVFFIQLSTEQSEVANIAGWSGSEATRLYADIVTGVATPDLNRAAKLGLYELAAQVTTVAHEDVFGIVQNLDHAWTHDARAVAITARPRSMMVGDIVFDHATQIYWLCASFGWTELKVEEFPILNYTLTLQILTHFATLTK